MASFISPVLRGASGLSWQLGNTRTGATLAERVEFAFDSATRRRGLLGRTVWDAGNALVIAPSNAIHTFFMKFPIDVLFVRKDGRVLKTHELVKAWRIAGALSAYAVIELPAETLKRCETQVGDIVEFSASSAGVPDRTRVLGSVQS